MRKGWKWLIETVFVHRSDDCEDVICKSRYLDCDSLRTMEWLNIIERRRGLYVCEVNVYIAHISNIELDYAAYFSAVDCIITFHTVFD